jgi:hypothetical protein
MLIVEKPDFAAAVDLVLILWTFNPFPAIVDDP